MYFVYVLKSESGDFHYIGHTLNVKKRLDEHNCGKIHTTKTHCPLTVIYIEEFQTGSAAQKREYYLKRGEGNFWLRDYLKVKGLW